jgi:aarF domain-containing kinase
MQRRVVARALVGAGLAGVTVSSAVYGHRNGDVLLVPRLAVRASRAVYGFLASALDYHFALRGLAKGSVGRKKALSDAHTRTAKRLLAVARANGGGIVKLGQFVASMKPGAPAEFTSVLAALTDEAVSPNLADGGAAAREAVCRELGLASIDQVFSEFDAQPVGSASIASVFRARVRGTGREVAVKVQHQGLDVIFSADLATVSALCSVYEMIRWVQKGPGEAEWSWIVPEFRAAVAEEIDFVREADNAEEVARSFAASGLPVHVPEVIRPLSTKRLLVMEFVRGSRVDDLAGIEREGITAREVATALVDTFAHMIFKIGFLHADPHPGNILVRRSASTGRMELVLLDHGLYRRIEEPVRLGMSLVFRGIVIGDTEGIGAGARLLGGVTDARADLLTRILTFSRPEEDMRSRKGMSSEERREHFAKITKDIQALADLENQKTIEALVSKLLEESPRSLLYVLKTNALVRSLNFQLGGSPGDRINAYGRAAINNTGRSGWERTIDSARFWMNLTIFKAVAAVLKRVKSLTESFRIFANDEQLQEGPGFR